MDAIKWILVFPFLILTFIANAQLKPQLVLQTPHRLGIDYALFSKDGQLIYSFSKEERMIKIWQVRDGRLLKNIKLTSTFEPYLVIPENGKCLMIFIDSIVSIYKPV